MNVRSFRRLALSAAIAFAAIGLSPGSAHNQTAMAGNDPHDVNTFAATLNPNTSKSQAAANHSQSAYSSDQSGNAEVSLLCFKNTSEYSGIWLFIAVGLIPVIYTYSIVQKVLALTGHRPNGSELSWWKKLCDRNPFFAIAIAILAAAGSAFYGLFLWHLTDEYKYAENHSDEPPGDMN